MDLRQDQRGMDDLCFTSDLSEATLDAALVCLGFGPEPHPEIAGTRFPRAAGNRQASPNRGNETLSLSFYCNRPE
jgi:hypothetical protein